MTDTTAAPDGGGGEFEVVTVTPVTAGNWRAVADLDVRDEQRAFVASVLHYLALCAYDGGPWHPLAVYRGATVVGFVMEGVDTGDDSYWVGGLLIDAASQGRGFGRATVRAMIERARAGSHLSVGLSFHPDNTVARRLYVNLGFIETGEVEGDERVGRLSLEA